MEALKQLQINESKSLLIDAAYEKVNKDQGALISGRTSITAKAIRKSPSSKS